MTANDNFVKKLLGFSTATWLSAGISIVSIPIMAHLFPPNQMGGIAMFQTLISILLMITMCGQDQAYIRIYFDKEKENDKDSLFVNSIFISFICWIICAIIILIFANKISFWIFGEINIFAVVIALFTALPTTLLVMLGQAYRIEQNLKKYTIQAVSITLFTKIIAVIPALVKPDYNTYIVSYCAATWGITLIYLFVQRKRIFNGFRYFQLRLSKFIPLMRFGLPLLPVTLIFVFKDNFPKFILANFQGLYDIGLYAMSLSVASLLTIIHSGFNTYWCVYVYENYEKDNTKFDLIFNLITFILVLGCIILTWSSVLIGKLLGPQYINVGRMFPIAFWPAVMYTISEVTVSGINITKKVHYHFYISILSFVTVVVVSMALVPRYGAVGGLYSLGISGFVFLLFRTIFGLRLYRTVKRTYKCWISLAVMVILSIMNYYYYEDSVIKTGYCFIGICVLMILYLKEISSIVVWFKSKLA